MRKGWLLLGLTAAVICAPAMAQSMDTRVRDNEGKIRELQAQIDLLRKTAKELEVRTDDLSKPAADIIDAYLRDKGVAAVTFVDAEGNPLEETVEQISLSGGLRMRYEYWDNMDFDDDQNDHAAFVANRLRLGIGFQFSEKVEANVELAANYLSGGGSGLNNLGEVAIAPALPGDVAPGLVASLNDQDSLKIYQAYVTFKDVNLLGRLYLPVDIKLGRQELAYGTGFLLGDERFNAGLSWDALRVVGKAYGLQLDIFASKLVENDVLMDLAGNVDPLDPTLYDDGDGDAELYGLYASYTGIPDTTLDGYLLYLRSGIVGPAGAGWVPGEPAFNLGIQDEMDLFTMGARAQGRFAGDFNYNAELAFQFGDRSPGGGDSQDVSALGAQAELKYTMRGVSWQPAIGLLYAYASGDNDAGDDDYERFEPLFQYNHGFYGLSDMLRTSNVQIFGVTASARPRPSVQFGAAWYMSMAVDDNDAIAGGINMGTSSKDDIANEIDFWLDTNIGRSCQLQLGWAMVMPGDRVEDTAGSDDTMHRIYANLNLSF